MVIKEYRLSIFVLLIMAIIVVFNTKGSSNSQSVDGDINQSYSLMNVAINVDSTSDVIKPQNDVDIPLPLKDVPEQILFRKGYVVSYNKESKLPNWVAWHLSAEHVDGEARRPGNAWHEDMDVPSPRVNSSDYKGSGWTRGHMCPAGDCKWDSDVMYESFLYSNCCPQNATQYGHVEPD